MTSRIEQDVRQRVSHLARRAEDVQVVAVRENATASVEYPVHRSRQARRDGFHPGRQVPLAHGFCDQVHVIVLDRVMHQPEAPAVARFGEAALQLSHQPDRAQRGQVALHFQRHVAGKPRRERRTRPVRMARAWAALAARTRASAAPARRLPQIQIELTNSPRHDPHCDMQM